MNRITALLAAHNRRDSTLRSISELYAQQGLGSKYALSIVLVDDGSTDGTSEAIAESFPDVQIVQGTGDLYWGRGMYEAFLHADQANTDFYLLLNDDTYLYPDALHKAIRFSAEKMLNRDCMVGVGAVLEPRTDKVSYGGMKRSSRVHPFRYQRLGQSQRPQRCDTFNGNFVFLPRCVVERVGFLDPVFTHRFGDIDLGLRAGRAGIEVWTLPGLVGECARNNPKKNWDSAELSFTERLRMFSDVKGVPLRESWRFCRRHGGMLWPVWWIMPVIRGLFFPTRYS